MTNVFNEYFLGYCMDKKGMHDVPIKINSDIDFANFLCENIEKYYELRITDIGDNLAFHAVNQVLLFPIPSHGSVNNKWDKDKRQFVSI